MSTSNMGVGKGPGKLDRIETAEALKEKQKEMMAMGSQQEDINKPEPNVF